MEAPAFGTDSRYPRASQQGASRRPTSRPRGDSADPGGCRGSGAAAGTCARARAGLDGESRLCQLRCACAIQRGRPPRPRGTHSRHHRSLGDSARSFRVGAESHPARRADRQLRAPRQRLLACPAVAGGTVWRRWPCRPCRRSPAPCAARGSTREIDSSRALPDLRAACAARDRIERTGARSGGRRRARLLWGTGAAVLH